MTPAEEYRRLARQCRYQAGLAGAPASATLERMAAGYDRIAGQLDPHGGARRPFA